MKTLEELNDGVSAYMASVSIGNVPRAKDHRLHELPEEFGALREILDRGLAHFEDEVDAADVCVRCGITTVLNSGRRRKGKWTCEDCLSPKRRRKRTPAK